MSKLNNKGLPYSVSQNFLTSSATISRLIRKTDLSKKDTVLEIGAGKGHITRALARQCGHVVSYEIDPKLYERLLPQVADNVLLRHQDFLDARLPKGSYKVFANIPFSITTAIVRKLVNSSPAPRAMWLIMEKGAAKRFCGQPKETLTSLLIKPFFDTRIVYHLRREDFHPAPRVDVVMLEFLAKEAPDVTSEERVLYEHFMTWAFSRGIGALLTKKQISTALRLSGLPPLEPGRDILYIQWLCLFRCWLRYGKRN